MVGARTNAIVACGVAIVLGAPTSILGPVAGLSVGIVTVVVVRWWRAGRRSTD
ncbi:hypothetical protein FHS07_000700 [Microbacterium proteolyticum]|uniref:Uncharacterized protein n=1 Tax=Microbacterium proteolyticum TaxID=1572644 RepID=A0A7W5GEH2_9MICO|nr:hypothetical protein [Microbacterium proteolyticum]MBB3157016.1 hypothetical protein [Microbacterium proteolyticum]